MRRGTSNRLAPRVLSPQLLYDLGIRGVDKPTTTPAVVNPTPHTVGMITPITIPWSPMAPLKVSMDKWNPPSPSLRVHLLLGMVSDSHRPPVAKAARAKVTKGPKRDAALLVNRIWL